MRFLFLILMMVSLFLGTACSKKESSGSAPATTTTTDTNTTSSGGTTQSDIGLTNGKYGQLIITDDSNYKLFFKDAFYYVAQVETNTQQQQGFGLSCNDNIINWALASLAGGLFSCDQNENELDNYIEWLANEGSVIEIVQIDTNTNKASIRVYLGSYLEDFSGVIVQDEHVRTLDIQADMLRNSTDQAVLDGRDFIMTGTDSNDQTFTLSYKGNIFGQVTLR